MINPSDERIQSLFQNLDRYWGKEITYKFDPIKKKEYDNFILELSYQPVNELVKDNYNVTNGELKFTFQSDTSTLEDLKESLKYELNKLYNDYTNDEDDDKCMYCPNPRISPNDLFCTEHDDLNLRISDKTFRNTLNNHIMDLNETRLDNYKGIVKFLKDPVPLKFKVTYTTKKYEGGRIQRTIRLTLSSL